MRVWNTEAGSQHYNRIVKLKDPNTVELIKVHLYMGASFHKFSSFVATMASENFLTERLFGARMASNTIVFFFLFICTCSAKNVRRCSLLLTILKS